MAERRKFLVENTPKKAIIHNIPPSSSECMLCNADVRKGTSFSKGRRCVTGSACLTLRQTLSVIEPAMNEFWQHMSVTGTDLYVCYGCSNKIIKFQRTLDRRKLIQQELEDNKKGLVENLMRVKTKHIRWKRTTPSQADSDTDTDSDRLVHMTSRPTPRPTGFVTVTTDVPFLSVSSMIPHGTPKKSYKFIKGGHTPQKIPVPISPARPMPKLTTASARPTASLTVSIPHLFISETN